MSKKIFIDFPVATGQGTEDRAQANFDREHNPDNDLVAYRWLKWVGIGFLIVLFMVVLIGILVYNDAPTWITTCVILFMLCVVSVSYAIVMDKKLKK